MFKKLFSHTDKVRKKNIVIVSGLPRSGTSMMMKMLTEGGLSAVVDSLRQADEDNPNGYFEIEASKALKDGDKRWLYDAQGKVVKVISYLLEFLPDDLSYDIIFMEREIGEILASQQKMLQRRNEKSTHSDAEMEAQFREHLRAVKYWAARKTNMRILFVKYSEMVKDPESLCKSIVDFLEIPLDLQAMQSVPSQSLYRNRS
ncbi:MAG: sulfotransferase [Anaerolineales bacterium]|uniref:sulfotransferase family protein n=1 Tax=Candidatus Villigracilis proximus TaxID=3140683 RepID=UPI00313767F6|nr:sulfotransferase [Anaerolineales bacterium]